MTDSASLTEKQAWTGSRAQRKAWALKKEMERQARSIAAAERRAAREPQPKPAQSDYVPSPAARIPSLGENSSPCTKPEPKPWARYVARW